MNVVELLKEANGKGIILYLEKGKLAFKAPPGAMDNTIKAQIVAMKSDIVELLEEYATSGAPQLRARPAQVGDSIITSYAQQRLWFIDSLQGGSAEYNMPVAFEVKGQLDLSILSRVFTTILERHEVLRTVYVAEAGRAHQYIRDVSDIDFEIKVEDCTHLSGDALTVAVNAMISHDMDQPFNLKEDLMLRVSYVKKASDSGVLLFNMHHIASDGWSTEVLIKEFLTLYHVYSEGQENPLPPLDIQYADYTYWQKEYLEGEVLDKQLNYWEKQLHDAPMIHSLPCDYPRPKTKQHIGAIVTHELSSNLAQGLLELAKSHNLTPFMLVHSALSLLLARHSNSDDIVIGTPIANRLQAELEPMIGLFVNTLVLRTNTHHETLSRFFEHIRLVNLDAQSNQDVPFEQLVERLKVPRSTEHSPLFQIMLTTNSDFGVNSDSNAQCFQLPNVELQAHQSDLIQSKFDLELNVSINEQGVSLNWIYDVSLFSESHIAQLNTHLCELLSNLSHTDVQADQAPHAVPILPQEEVHHLVHTLNSTQLEYPNEQCIHELFEEQVAKTPESVALTFENESLTYKQLNEKANQIAHFLQINHGVKPDTLVGLCVERSLEMVISILGILKAGGAYVPLDPTHPQSRINDILEDTTPEVVLTQAHLTDKLSSVEGKLLILDQEADGESIFTEYSIDNIDKASISLTSENLVYVIYTSGTTGKPKGIMVQHKALIARKVGWDEIFEIDKQPLTVLQMAGLSVDILLGDIVKALCSNGGKLVICSYQTLISPSDLHRLIEHHQVSYGDFVPSVIRVLTSHLLENKARLTSFQHISIGCEAWKKEDLALLTQVIDEKTDVYNLYGQTETVIDTSYYKANYQDMAKTNMHSMPLGTPFPNTSLYILDDNLQLAPQGVSGTLYVAGDGLAMGYYNNTALTNEKFVHNQSQDLTGNVLYCTGDLVRYLPDGNLEFIGRADDQVKIRGFRIELGEVESQLIGLTDIDTALVMAKESSTGKQLVGYIKLDGEFEHSTQLDIVTRTKASLKANLPDYMVPGAIIVVDTWPLTSNGKIDKKALPDPDLSQDEYSAPTTDVERNLADTWAELLNLDATTISITANFFELGGHSLLISRLIASIDSEYGVSVSIKDVFGNPTIQHIAEKVIELQALTEPAVVPAVSESKNSIVI
ncbi:non-ribosomal peptide synthetase [Pseudoalteromonas sp. MSK9-3]|uniref:non-ribosomal peptide synthetase n=1 Tax=Pseudoalteromonas sp. MSK9-3 TaxID=1897633 RepID=UPI000E6D0D44|nr:non-ribosomal peptide synthetase [Pseudoalteromonas sp. MSK9-3]RJE73424.1 non-ribosomal peptide synthetase [Pseudoalteromonas sp. MSK9-3]